MRSIAVVNQKGGCGKTITAINVSAFLADQQRRVLLIDMDPQGHATLGLQTDPVRPDRTITDVLLPELNGGRLTLRQVRRTVLPGLDLVPADIMLSALPDKLSGVPGREDRLAEALAEVGGEYDYVIIDCPPHVGLLTFNALMACSEAIIPLDPSFFSLHGIAKLLETLNVVARKTGHDIEPRALITLYTGRSQFVKEVVGDIRKHLPERAFGTIIRFSIKLAEAASHGLPISHYCTRCAGFEDYQMLTAEILEQEPRRPAVGIPAEPAVSAELESTPAGAEPPPAPTPTSEGIVFTLDAPEAHRVQLAGDFNAWEPGGADMECCGGVWRTTVSLAPGRYLYRYVVDGSWQRDPQNPEVEPSPFGDYNSVIVLAEHRAGLASQIP
jgi:chromosome partitioning protein